MVLGFRRTIILEDEKRRNFRKDIFVGSRDCTYFDCSYPWYRNVVWSGAGQYLFVFLPIREFVRFKETISFYRKRQRNIESKKTATAGMTTQRVMFLAVVLFFEKDLSKFNKKLLTNKRGRVIFGIGRGGA